MERGEIREIRKGVCVKVCGHCQAKQSAPTGAQQCGVAAGSGDGVEGADADAGLGVGVGHFRTRDSKRKVTCVGYQGATPPATLWLPRWGNVTKLPQFATKCLRTLLRPCRATCTGKFIMLPN